MTVKLHPLVLAITLAVSVQSYGDHPPSKNVQIADKEITDIHITGTQPPLASGTLISEDLIKAKSAATSDSAALLKGLPGVSAYGAGGVSSLPVIRGLGDDRIRIKLDGMDLVSACGNHMNPPLSYVDPNNIDFIEVFAGITPVSMGGDSIGGTIVVESSSPTFTNNDQLSFVSGNAGAFYRSNGNAQGVSLSTSAASSGLSLRYSGAFARSDNYDAGDDFKPAGPAAMGRGHLDGDEVGSTAYETQNHKVGIAFQKDNHMIDLEIGYQHIPYQGFPNQRMDMLENTSTQVVLTHKADYQWAEVESRLYREKTRHKMNFGTDKQFWYGDAPGMPMETEGENTGFTSHVEYPLSESSLLRLGGEVQQYTLDDWWPPSGSGMMMAPNTFWNIRDGKRDRYAAFAEWQATLSPEWSINTGVRYENVRMDSAEVEGYSMMYMADAMAFNSSDRKKSDDNWDLSLQGQYIASKTQTYRIGLARKTRSPNLYERYTWSTVGMAMRMVNLAGDGNGYVGNLELEPEIAHTISLSGDWHDAKGSQWQLVVTPFYTQVDDYIDATPCIAMMCNTANAMPGFRYLTFTNDDARLYGVDVSGFKHLLHTDALGNLVVRAVISYLDGENDTTGDNLYNIMPLNGTFSIEQSSGKWTNTVEWQLVTAKDDTSAVRNEVDTAGYGLLNLRTSVSLNNIRLDVGVENALDKGYELPLGGAYLGQGKTMSGNDVPWGIAVPGAGRSIYAGLSYDF
jgi:iron complex outermembrane receptor protein